MTKVCVRSHTSIHHQHPTSYQPIGSMYGIFTYIYHKNSAKCRQIYHTWILWVPMSPPLFYAQATLSLLDPPPKQCPFVMPPWLAATVGTRERPEGFNGPLTLNINSNWCVFGSWSVLSKLAFVWNMCCRLQMLCWCWECQAGEAWYFFLPKKIKMMRKSSVQSPECPKR